MTQNIRLKYFPRNMKKNQKDKYLMTQEGLEELKKELKTRVEDKKTELSDIIEDMKEKGDVSENEGLYLAQDEFEANERRIAELADLIENAHISNSCAKGKVCVSSKVTLKSNSKKYEYHIVGEDQANPLENKISYKSPLGSSLMDRNVGDKVKVDTPTGTAEYSIEDVK